MDQLKRSLQKLSTAPPFGTPAYTEWLKQEDFIAFLISAAEASEAILFASLGSTFIHTLLGPNTSLKPLDVDDLMRWDCNPYSSWGITYGPSSKVSISPPAEGASSITLEKAEQLVFLREFDGRQEKGSYVEILQRLTHPFDLHYVPERNAYCRFDRHGDIEDVIRIIEIEDEEPRSGADRIVTIRRGVLNEYMAITKSTLVTLFDSTRFNPGNFGGWHEQEEKEHSVDSSLYCRMGIQPGIASYVRGFQLTRSPLTRRTLAKRFSRDKERKYTTFIAHDFKHNEIRECSCDPKKLGNYFVPSDLPFETTPAFFRPEVLHKYKADPDKYQISDRSIRCRNAWYLQTYDINDADQVHTYLIYLSRLPYEEQLYWKSFNEPPKAPISPRAFKTDFEGSWDIACDPLNSIKSVVRELWEAKTPWWTLRSEDLLKRTHYPATRAAEEWAKEIHTLDKLLVEGFETKEIKNQAAKLGRELDDRWRSLALLEQVLMGLGYETDQASEITAPLRELTELRSKVIGHASGERAIAIKKRILKEHGTYRNHFRDLCERCDESLRRIRDILNQRIYEAR